MEDLKFENAGNFDNDTNEKKDMTPEPKKKRGRGRPKGSTKKKKEEAKKKETPPSGGGLFDEIESLAAEYEDTPPSEELPRDDIENFAELVNGSMLMIVTDAYIPGLLLGLISAFYKKRKGKKLDIKLSSIRMTDEQRKDIEPIADEAAKHVLRGVSPLGLYIICTGGIYLNNILNEIAKK